MASRLAKQRVGWGRSLVVSLAHPYSWKVPSLPNLHPWSSPALLWAVMVLQSSAVLTTVLRLVGLSARSNGWWWERHWILSMVGWRHEGLVLVAVHRHSRARDSLDAYKVPTQRWVVSPHQYLEGRRWEVCHPHWDPKGPKGWWYASRVPPASWAKLDGCPIGCLRGYSQAKLEGTKFFTSW